ncbi:hypothetical protein C5472_22145 [Photorhabdus sp. RW14-46]|nr:hypothetical protein [Photorhabdus sp. RW14-46]
MLYYYAVLFMMLFMGLLEQYYFKNKPIVYLLSFIIITIGLSCSISRGDYYSYYYFFHDIDIKNPTLILEPGFFWLAYLIKLCTEDEFYLFLLAASLSIIIKFLAIKKLNKFVHINCGYYFSLYFSTFLVYLDLGSIRFSIATSFLFLATIYLLERKYKIFYIVIILGILFHKSLMLALVLPILTQRKYLRTFLIISIISGLLLISLSKNEYIINILNSNYYLSKIISYSRFGSVRITFQLIKKILLIFFFYYVFKKEIKNKGGYIYICWVVTILSFCLYGLFLSNQIIASRYLLMFGICEPIILIMIYRKLSFKSKHLYSLILFLYIIINYGHSIYSNSNHINLYLPYKNYLLGDKQPYITKSKQQELLRQSGI